MRQINEIIFFTVLNGIIFSLNSCGQDSNNRTFLGEKYARAELDRSLKDKSIHNVISAESILIQDKKTAIAVAETVLFKIYDKNEIIDERPYETYFIDNYWVIMGTLPKEYDGGTFLIIIDSRDCRIIRITHSK